MTLQVKADSVKIAVASASTCTTTTVTLLSDLLSTKAYVQELESLQNTESTLKRSHAPKSRSAPTSKSSVVARQKNRKIPGDELSPKEKAILATEVINATLKSLSNPGKTASSIWGQKSLPDVKDSPRQKVLRRSTSLPQSPLQERSLNRVSSSPNIDTRSSRSLSLAPMTSSSYRATAECSRIAFACMRALQSSRAPCVMDISQLQLENGMSALIGKLIAHGLDELAAKELRILKRRLDMISKGLDKNALQKNECPESHHASNATGANQSLVELLDFEVALTGGAVLLLAISTQLQVLKLLASSKKPTLVTATLPKLHTSYQSSPIRLLLKSFKESSTQATKVARQFEMLSQLILSLCPNVSTSYDAVAVMPNLSTPPAVALQLQSLALYTRVLRWDLYNHQGDIEKDVLLPFSRCLAAFTRRNRCLSIETYQCALRSFETIQDIGAKYSDFTETGFRSPLLIIYKLLGSLSQDAGCFSDAVSWLGMVWEIYKEAPISGVQHCAVATSLLALKLLISASDVEVENLLMVVLSGLEGPLKGESLELDELLSEVSKARRAAILRLYKQDSGSENNTVNAMSDKVRQMCESLILLCPRFSIRYLGKPPDSSSAPKAIVRYEQRRQFLAKSGFHSIDSVLYIMRKFQSEGRFTWELIDSTLQDCLRLLECIGNNTQASADEPTGSVTSYFVKISQLYFSQHLNMRRDAEGPKDIRHVRPLRRAIECVSGRPVLERKAAFLNSKLERLADIYKVTGRQNDASDTLVALHKELVRSGVLSRVAVAASTKPLREAWCECEDASMLARAISSLVKLEQKSGSKLLQIPLYDVTWPVQEKGLVLEHILDVLYGQPRGSQNGHKDVFHELLVLYDQRKFPVRRLRIVTRLLKQSPDQRRDISDDVKNTLAISQVPAVTENSEDIGLLSYLPHLQAFASTVLELQEDHPRVDLLRPHLASWYSILEKPKDHASLAMIVDDVSELLSHLISIADFLHMKGFGKVRVAVLRMIANLNEIPRTDSCPDDLVLSYTSLGLQYAELGYSGKAGLSFDRAQSYASRNGVTSEALLQVHLSYAEYFLAIRNLGKCEETLLRAQAIALQNPEILTPLKASGNLQRKNYLIGLAAHAYLVHSVLDLERGAVESALGYAKRSVKLIRYSWVKIGTYLKSKVTTLGATGAESLPEDTLNLSVSTSIPSLTLPSHEQIPGPLAWALVSPLFKGLSLLSALYAYNGMFQETIYYAEQAHKLVQLTDSGDHLTAALTATGSAWLSAGKLDRASELFVKAKEVSQSSWESQTTVVLNCQLGRLYGLLDNREATFAAYDHAHATLETLSSVKYIGDIDRINNPTALLEEEMSQLTIKARKPARSRKGVVSRKASKEKTVALFKFPVEAANFSSDECIRLASLKGLLLRQKAGAHMLWKQYEDAVLILKEAEGFSRNEIDIVDQHMSTAKQLLLQSVGQMLADSVYSVLQDSTISIPAVVSPSRTAAGVSERSSGTRLTPQRKHQGNLSNRDHHRSKSPPLSGFFDKLQQAQDRLTEAHSIAVQLSSTAIIHSLSSLLYTVTTFLSAAGPSLGKAICHPNISTYSMELSRNIALQRERKTILNDPGSSTQTDDELRWPITTMMDHKGSKTDSAHDALRFRKEYIDIIPQGWTAISISLSESRQELYLTKMHAGQSPFTLRLPLGRNNSRDADEEVFDFDQGKTELLEIIELANDNSHGAKDLTGREAKTAWWAERDALDARLKDLLENIETVWLGGFKGIFSQHRPRPDMLARFQRSFQNILDKHLPSRQNINKKCKSGQVTLDTQILELFIGLEEASAEECDLDEALTDLLYFVVDILQFHGERNAYDEIDFDSIVIETHDALQSYHEAVLAASSINEDKHTILILDKALHAFPWESLPCMDGQAVSRLPSLNCLKERILAQPNSSTSTSLDRYYVEAVNGGYVLNPGGDLKTTQSTFENDLQGLSTWSSIIKREPTESEIRDNLESKDIFLYFGHGSGAQYIRPKAIKRLKKCAVTMLMGCSSGALTEAGEFESYGPPIDYMLAGCPALVATLWDVTDKDIDRCAKSTFEHWGLFDSQSVRNEQSSKGKGKKKAEPSVMSGERKSLVKAVAEGRRACNFRYLTAAAVCVYGIPVYLK